MQFGSKKQSRLKPNDGELLWGFGLGNESVIMIMNADYAVQKVIKCYQLSTDVAWNIDRSYIKIYILLTFMNLAGAFFPKQLTIHCT